MFFQRLTKAARTDYRWKAPQLITRAASSPHALEHPALRLQRTIGNQAVGRLLSSGTAKNAQLEPESKEKGGGKKAKGQASGWRRKLKRKPRLLDGRKASYDITFSHVLPTPPKGATQMWQVVEVKKQILSDKCKLDTEQSFIVDIVDIGKRTEIPDQWGWIHRQDPCFATEVNQATVGFDDQKSNFDQQTNVQVTEKLAKEVLGKMAGPKGTYSGSYTFVKKTNCPDCDRLGKVQKEHSAPDGEALKIPGLGEWTS